MGQLLAAKGKETAGTTNRLQEQLSYVYDAAGNLNWRTNNELVQSFGVNAANELTTLGRSGTLTVAGTTTSAATNVAVNTYAAELYGDATFAKAGFSLSDGANTFTAIAQDNLGRTDTNTVSAYLPASANCQYDANGNLLTDGRRYFEYDDENQLTAVTVSNAWRSEFIYDGKMRRRVRKEFTWVASTWSLAAEIRYVYDGNLVTQERAGSNLPEVTYTRGKDLSGTLEGAGGIGGLLARSDHRLLAISDANAHACYHADGNGNITCLINAYQLIAARYLYDPYGNILSQSGPLAEANLYRFSSKEFHAYSGLVYYLYRCYEPGLQRWPNRDPIGERGGKNLYAFVNNTPVNRFDPLGLYGFGHGIGGPLIDFCQAAKDKTCNNAVGANVLLQLRLNGIDGNDDAGGGNAFRHCLAARQSAKTCGEDSAKRFWNGREDGSTAAGRQDLANNGVGFGNASQSSCWDACMSSWNNGGLTCGNGPCPPRPSSHPPQLPPPGSGCSICPVNSPLVIRF